VLAGIFDCSRIDMLATAAFGLNDLAGDVSLCPFGHFRRNWNTVPGHFLMRPQLGLHLLHMSLAILAATSVQIGVRALV
jgi:hypothetical protein